MKSVWPIVWICARPDTGRLLKQIALDSIRATARQDARRLIGQEITGIDHLIFQGNLLARMLTETYFLNLPNPKSHRRLQLTIYI